ncbi:hypothetical protein, partial [Escherichia coli]|uniref:hypothetical protein n=1 Tax=Escherichia coli TaxID=562 RepID=UPI001F277550
MDLKPSRLCDLFGNLRPPFRRECGLFFLNEAARQDIPKESVDDAENVEAMDNTRDRALAPLP